MTLLAIDTSTRYCCLAIESASRCSCVTLELGRAQSVLLESVIENALVCAGVRMKDITMFACGVGPGSFTGIRMGMSAIKGLAWALQVPVVGIGSLDLVACNVLAQVPEGQRVAVCMDAKRGLVYAAEYRRDGQHMVRRARCRLLTPQAFAASLLPATAVTGDGVGLYADIFRKKADAPRLFDKDYWYPRAEYLCTLAHAAASGTKRSSALTLAADYLYPKECQIKR